MALAVLIGAALLAFVLTRPSMAPAGPAALVVNSTANTSDGQCDANCTLREAIDAANTGLSNTIHFDPAVFPVGAPAVIDIEGGAGALPSITADVTIDATGSGVIIDGDATNDGTAVAQGLKIDGSHTGFGFTLHGGGHFTLRDIGARGIDIVGHGFAADTVSIDGVVVTNTSDNGIYVSGVPYATHVSLTNSTVDAGKIGVGIIATGPEIQNTEYILTGDDIRSAHASSVTAPAIRIDLQAGLAPGTAVNITIDHNARIRSRSGAAINLTYCSSSTPCAMDHSQINVSISGNTEVTASTTALVTKLNANPPAPASSTGSAINFHIDNNAAITAGSSHGTDVSSVLCCGSNNQQNFSVDGNGPITTDPITGSKAVDIETGSCCTPGSGNSIEVNHNHGDIAAGAANGIQLQIDCCGDNSISIVGNEGLIIGAGSNSIQIRNCVADDQGPLAAEADCIARTTTLLAITNNLIGGSAEDGIHICCGQFQRGDQRSVISNNTVADNGRDGIEINSSHGINVGPDNIITRNGSDIAELNDAVKINFEAAALLFNGFGAVVPNDGNTITKNQIYANGGLGIDLVGFNPAGNPAALAPDDIEYKIVGCNLFPLATINANDCRTGPVLNGESSDTLHGQACADCRIEVFLANDQPPDQTDSLGDQHGEGAQFLAAGNTNGTGDFSILLPCGLAAGLLTATATDGDGNTSEFSKNLAFTGTSTVGCPATPTPTVPLFSPTPTRTPPATATATRTPTPPAATATATRTATATTVPGICGDVDGDRSVSSIDAALVLQYTAGLLETLMQPDGADVNNDGMINSIDVALILQNTAGLPANLHC